MAYVAQTQEEDDEEAKKKNAAAPIGGEAGPDASAPGQNLAQPQPYTQTGFASAKSILSKNKGGEDKYDVTQPFQEDLDKSKADLSSNWGKLQASIGQQVGSQKTSDDDLADAIQKGQQSGGWNRVMGALSPQQVTGQLGRVQNKYTANDVGSLNSTPGIQAAIANQAEKKGVQNYTQGMGALDAAIYQSNPNFRQKVAGLSNAYGEQAAQANDYAAQAKSAIEKSNKELADNAEAMKGRLGSRADEIKTASAKNNNTVYQDYMTQARNQALSKEQSKIQETANSIEDPWARQQFLNELRTSGLSVASENTRGNQTLFGKYYKPNDDGSQYAFREPDAAQFNNIMALLGNNERVDPYKINGKLDEFGIDRELQPILQKYDAAGKARAATTAAEAQRKASEQAAAQASLDKEAARKKTEETKTKKTKAEEDESLRAAFGTPLYDALLKQYGRSTI